MLLLIQNHFWHKYPSLQKKMELHSSDVIWYNSRCLASPSPWRHAPQGQPTRQALILYMIYWVCTFKKIQVDPGSTLSIIPKRLLYFLGIPLSRLLIMTITIYSFNVGSSHPLGKIRVWWQIGDLKLEVTCYVIDANMSYKFLLGQPWIHAN